MDISNPNSPITPSLSKASSFHSIFRDQQQQLRKLAQEVSALKQHSEQLTAENSQLKLALATTHSDLTGESAVKTQRYRSAPFSSHVHIPGLVSYEKHIQSLQRDKLCAKVQLSTAESHVSELTQTVDMLERQVDKIHREYRNKLIELSNHPHYYLTQPPLINPVERVAREIRESYSQQLIDLRERCKLYRSQTYTLRRSEKELKLKQVLLEHTTRSCLFNQTCVDSCVSLIRRIAGLVETEAHDPALLKACGIIQHTLTRLLPQMFERVDTEFYTEERRECPQSELVGQYDHLLEEIKLYKS